MEKECLEKYMAKLEKGLMEYMSMPLSQRSAEAVDAMVECWEHVNNLAKACDCPKFDEKTASEWNKRIVNEDGSIGGFWSVEDTRNFLPYGMNEYCWNVAMNMVYSDFKSVAEKYGVDIVDFYVDMANAWLNDKDIDKKPDEKLAAYYAHVVE